MLINHWIVCIAFDIETYPASAVDNATQFCFPEIHDWRLFPCVNVFPAVDFLSSRSLANMSQNTRSKLEVYVYV